MTNLIKFKPAVVLVDNEDQVIKALVSELCENFEVLTFNNPADSIDQIIEACENKVTCEIKNSLSGNEFFNKKIISKSWCYYNSIVTHNMKFNICVISDYEMPFINGITLLDNLQPNIKKLLLTGVFTKDKAIDALNSDRIDAYVEKGLGSFRKIDEVLARFTSNFFRKESFCEGVNIPPFIENVMQTTNEYFVVDTDGSTVVGRSYYHVVTRDDLDRFINILPEDISDIRDQVKKCHLIPFLTDVPDDSGKIKEYMFDNFELVHTGDDEIIIKVDSEQLKIFSESFQGESNDD